MKDRELIAFLGLNITTFGEIIHFSRQRVQQAIKRGEDGYVSFPEGALLAAWRYFMDRGDVEKAECLSQEIIVRYPLMAEFLFRFLQTVQEAAPVARAPSPVLLSSSKSHAVSLLN